MARRELSRRTICDGTQNTKRLTVAVTVAGAGAVPTGTPVWVSKVIPDPQALPPGATGTTGPTGSTISAQDFYLYDTPCGNTTATDHRREPRHAQHRPDRRVREQHLRMREP